MWLEEEDDCVGVSVKSVEKINELRVSSSYLYVHDVVTLRLVGYRNYYKR